MTNRYISPIIYTLFIISLCLGIFRLFPYIETNIALGYDPGLYRILFLDYFNNLPNINFDSLNTWTQKVYPPFLGILGNILLIIGISVENLLSWGLGFFSVITSIFLYLTLKKYSRVTGVLAMTIFFISIIQYEAFLLNYYKQIIGIIFMLAGFYLLEKKKYFLSFPIIISLFAIHRPSGVYFLGVFILYKSIQIIFFKDRAYKDIYIVFVAGFIALCMYVPLFDTLILPLLEPLLTTIGNDSKSGTFLLKEQFGELNLMVILMSLYGFYIKLQKKDFDIITCGYIFGIIWIGGGMFFYNRMYVFFDIFIICMAAYTLGYVYEKYQKIFLPLFVIFFIFQSLYYINYVRSHDTTYIPPEEFEKIQEINTIVPENAYIMVTHKNYSPWLYGYSDRPIIAPGLFEYDLWSIEQWESWWQDDNEGKCELLKETYSHIPSIYIWEGAYQGNTNISEGNCFEYIWDTSDYHFLKINLNSPIDENK